MNFLYGYNYSARNETITIEEYKDNANDIYYCRVAITDVTAADHGEWKAVMVSQLLTKQGMTHVKMFDEFSQVLDVTGISIDANVSVLKSKQIHENLNTFILKFSFYCSKRYLDRKSKQLQRL